MKINKPRPAAAAATTRPTGAEVKPVHAEHEGQKGGQ
jgi:hypothetical protein